ncbi:MULTISPECIES: hypothetical protein [unclassified Haladaptatus]|uniref:hypothetical protein n=1 Tax=unclassified Haladaptatus TaxID=2622732 RepID=UPI0023E8EDF2|nr:MULTISPECIES: hypothetical protein [unclassified Haladaptatus]
MSLIDTTMAVFHMLFAGLWVGGTLFFVGIVLPAARAGQMSTDGLKWIAGRFTTITTASILLLLITGGHLAGTFYTFEGLATTGRGHLVVSMVVLWLILAGLLQVGLRRLRRELGSVTAKVAVEQNLPLFFTAGIVAFALLVVAGLL